MKVGLLPFYITLYDDLSKKYRYRMERFYETIAKMLEAKCIEVVRNPFCMEEPDFENAIQNFEDQVCDAVVTLHMAYSPSLKSAKALKSTKLPIIICDTTDTYDFSCQQSPDEIMYCHGIHGVMDMCNLLHKNGKLYALATGHYLKSNVIDQVVGYIKAAVAAKSLYGSKVGTIGGRFDGMGDFAVSDDKLFSRFGVKVVRPQKQEINKMLATISNDQIKKEIERYQQQYVFLETPDEETLTQSVKADLVIKKWVKSNALQAFTVNFRDVEELPTMPFHGICEIMHEKIGYAGEGDILTAAFSGALLQQYPKTSFVELFCPDWEHSSVLISHMGEMNYDLANEKPELFVKPFTYCKASNPVTGSAGFKPGKGVFLNIFEDYAEFKAFITNVEVLPETTNNFKGNIRGWLKFERPIEDVLKKISDCGATHHSILIYDSTEEEIVFFAKNLGLKTIGL